MNILLGLGLAFLILAFIALRSGLVCAVIGHIFVDYVREYRKGQPGDELKYVSTGWYCPRCGEQHEFCRGRNPGELIGKTCPVCDGAGVVPE